MCSALHWAFAEDARSSSLLLASAKALLELFYAVLSVDQRKGTLPSLYQWAVAEQNNRGEVLLAGKMGDSFCACVQEWEGT